MNFDDGFTFVKPGKKSRRNVNTKIRNVLESVDIDVNDTIERIQKAKEELHQSEFMRKFLNNLDILEEIKFIYCFGLGQLSSSIARYQTAFVLIINESLRLSAGRLEVYDPVFSSKELGNLTTNSGVFRGFGLWGPLMEPLMVS
ncbi:uncharacterized protein LOC111707461 [Eurytemora carolleeae]|uniref:uncharacterized protein LOC111707461 n=1 Tax=Eurytemora carolleeae TaxID=1294199 RepID=UPI000C77ACAB|nr:uncharacterized protein LOC111707461 [Eurytemora carolleeae]|eukprot:XP_023336340.1 uncharacterized protein LOC111707461 [Eurytemora affinis]